MILDRYIANELIKPVVAICGLLAFIFGAYSASRYLADALTGQLSTHTILILVGLKVLIALDVLLPISLYLSAVLSMGRLRQDFEMTAMAAAGIGEGHIQRTVFVVCLLVAVVVGGISVFARPWAYTKSYRIQQVSAASLDLKRIQPGSFFQTPQNNGVIFAARRNPQTGHLQDVFAQHETGQGKTRHTQVIHAASLYQEKGSLTHPGNLVFQDGRAYDLDRNGQNDRVVHFHRLVLKLGTPQISVSDKRKAMPTHELIGAHSGDEVAELEWRLIAPLSTLLLGMLGVPLSRAAPRGGRYARVVIAVLVYAVYYYLANIARTWVKHGTVGAYLPGVWWAPAGLGLLLLILGAHPLAFRRRRRQVSG